MLQLDQKALQHNLWLLKSISQINDRSCHCQITTDYAMCFICLLNLAAWSHLWKRNQGSFYESEGRYVDLKYQSHQNSGFAYNDGGYRLCTLKKYLQRSILSLCTTKRIWRRNGKRGIDFAFLFKTQFLCLILWKLRFVFQSLRISHCSSVMTKLVLDNISFILMRLLWIRGNEGGKEGGLTGSSQTVCQMPDVEV